MLELVVAGSMLAGVMTSMSLVMRTARDSWEMSDTEYGVLHHMHAVGRHFVRAAREARGVASIRSDGSGITMEMRDGTTKEWAWSSASHSMKDVVTVQSSAVAQSSALAQNIASLQFVGFDADGVTTVTNPDDIRMVQVTVEVNVPKAAIPVRRMQSKVWIRSW